MFERAPREDYTQYRKRLTAKHIEVYETKPTYRNVEGRRQPLNKAELQAIREKLDKDLEGIPDFQAFKNDILQKLKNYQGPTDINTLKKLKKELETKVEEIPGGWSGRIILANRVNGEWERAELPTRLQIKRSIEDSIGPINNQDGIFSYQGVKSSGEMGPIVNIFPGAIMDEQIFDRLYGLCHTLSTDFHYSFVQVILRWVPTTFDWLEEFNVFQSRTIQNCAVKLLSERYTSLKDKIANIKLNPDGGFGKDQMTQVAKIIRKNVIMNNPFGTMLLKSDTSYKTDVVIYDVDAHAYNHIVEYPHQIDEVKIMDSFNYCDIKKLYGDSDYMIYACNEGFALSNGSRSFAIRRTDIFNDIQNRARELGYTDIKDYATLKNAFGVEFKKFREINDIKNTNFATSLWQQSNMNTSPYCKDYGDEAPVESKNWMTADMNSAYESFKNCEMYQQYGFPHHDCNRAFINPDFDILNETGISVVNVNLEKSHPWVRHRINYQTKVVLPNVILKFWGDRIAIENIELGIVAPKYMCELKRPENAKYNTDGTRAWVYEHENTYKNSKSWFRQAAGRLISNESKTQTIYVKNHSEAVNIIREAKNRNILKAYKYTSANPIKIKPLNITLTLEENYRTSGFNGTLEEYCEEVKNYDGYYTISIKDNKLTGAFHIHSYILAYCHIQIDKEVFAHDFDHIQKVLVDSITISEPFTNYITDNIEPEVIGKWKYEKFRYYQYCPPQPHTVTIDVENIGVYTKYLASSTPNLTILHAPPGHGKTFTCLNLIKNHRHIILSVTRKMAKKFKNEGFSALTRKFALNPYGAFDGVNMNLPKNVLIYVPEIGFWELEEAKPCIEWLLQHNYSILSDGDRSQMLPVNGTSAWDYFDKNHTVVDFVSEDYRSKDEETKQLKREIRGLTNAEIIEKIGTKKIEYLLENWHPDDYIYSSTHEIRQYLHKKLNEIYEEKYQGIPKRYIYTSKNKLSGEEVYELTQPEGTELAFCQTYNSCQGDTAELHRNVYLISDNTSEFFKNAIYVGATRIQKLSQLHIISLKQWI